MHPPFKNIGHQIWKIYTWIFCWAVFHKNISGEAAGLLKQVCYFKLDIRFNLLPSRFDPLPALQEFSNPQDVAATAGSAPSSTITDTGSNLPDALAPLSPSPDDATASAAQQDDVVMAAVVQSQQPADATAVDSGTDNNQQTESTQQETGYNICN